MHEDFQGSLCNRTGVWCLCGALGDLGSARGAQGVLAVCEGRSGGIQGAEDGDHRAKPDSWSLLLTGGTSPNPQSQALSVCLSVSQDCSAPASSTLPLTSGQQQLIIFLQGCDTLSHGMFFLRCVGPPQGEGGRIVLAGELQSQCLNVPPTVPKRREGTPRKAGQGWRRESGFLLVMESQLGLLLQILQDWEKVTRTLPVMEKGSPQS